jgi:hypothetical protein
MSIASTQKNTQSLKKATEAQDFASWPTDQLIKFAHDSLQKINDLEQEIAYMRNDLRSALQAYRSVVREKEASLVFASPDKPR